MKKTHFSKQYWGNGNSAGITCRPNLSLWQAKEKDVVYSTDIGETTCKKCLETELGWATRRVAVIKRQLHGGGHGRLT